MQTDYEKFRGQAEARVRKGDLFDFPCIVVPVMEGAQAYGGISRQAMAMGVVLPDLAIGEAGELKIGNQTMIFVGLWQREDRPGSGPKERAFAAATAAVRLAGVRGHAEVALPVFSAKGYGLRLLAAMEAGVDAALDWLEEKELENLPEVVFVSRA